jgi:hypothetical protein
MVPISLTTLSNHALLAETARLAGDERHTTAQLIALLAEVDTRELHLGEGYSSLFTYCMHALHLSESAAYDRITAARASRKFPVILERLMNGAVTLTTEPVALPTAAEARPTPPATPGPSRTTIAPVAELAPLAPDRYLIRVTVSGSAHAKLRRAQDLLRHAFPNGDPAAIVERALTVLVEQLERTRFGSVRSPRSSTTVAANSRRVPANVRRLVWERDAGQCAFVGSQGRCAETAFLEFHHVVPYAAGGVTSVENLALRCRAHNGYEAVQHFGATRSGTSSIERGR